MSKLVIWDFDGVICDSLVECITVTQVASAAINNVGLEITDSNLFEICNSNEVMDLYRNMKDLRPFIVKGQDYLWQYFNLNKFETSALSFDGYQKVLSTLFNADLDRIYEKAFYVSRRRVQEIMGKQYFSLFKPYSGALYAFRTSLKRNTNYICTARDRQGVELLFGNNGVQFARSKIFSKDFNGDKPNAGCSKTQQIEMILQREGTSQEQFVLVEDQVKAPQELRDTYQGMQVVYAEYGYGLQNDWKKARLPNVHVVHNPDELVWNIF